MEAQADKTHQGFELNDMMMTELEDNLFEHECWREFKQIYQRQIAATNKRQRDFITGQGGAEIFNEEKKQGIKILGPKMIT